MQNNEELDNSQSLIHNKSKIVDSNNKNEFIFKKKNVSVIYLKKTNNYINNHAIFKIIIKNDLNNKTIFRRFSHFNFLYEILISEYPFLIVPKIPEKDLINNLIRNEIFYKKRAKKLDIFFKEIIKVRSIHDLKEFQDFISFNEEQYSEILNKKSKEKTIYNNLNFYKSKLKNMLDFSYLTKSNNNFFSDKNDKSLDNEIFIKINKLSKFFPIIVQNLSLYIKNNNAIITEFLEIFESSYDSKRQSRTRSWIKNKLKKMKLLSYKILNCEQLIYRKNKLLMEKEELNNLIINTNPHEAFEIKENYSKVIFKIDKINNELKNDLEIKYQKYKEKVNKIIIEFNLEKYYKIKKTKE